MSAAKAVLLGLVIGTAMHFTFVPPNASHERVRQFNDQINVELLQWTLIPASLFIVYRLKKG